MTYKRKVSVPGIGGYVYDYDLQEEGINSIYQNLIPEQHDFLLENNREYDKETGLYNLYDIVETIKYKVTYSVSQEKESPIYKYIQREKYHLDYKEYIDVDAPVHEYIIQHNMFLEYEESKEIIVPVNKYISKKEYKVRYKDQRKTSISTYSYTESYEDNNFYDVEYIETSGNFFSRWFNKITRKIIQRKGVSHNELKLLQKQENKGTISSLKYFQVTKNLSRDLNLTQQEAFEYMSDGKNIRLNSQIPSGDIETVEEFINEKTVPSKDFHTFILGKEVVYTDKILETIDLTENEYIEKYQNKGRNLEILNQNISERKQTIWEKSQAYISADEYTNFIEGKRVISKRDDIITDKYTQKEYEDIYESKGKTLKVHKKNISKKKEKTERLGTAVIEKKDYNDFIQGKEILSSKIEKDFIELTKKEYEDLYESKGIFFELESHEPVGMKVETVDLVLTEMVSQDNIEAFRQTHKIISEEKISDKKRELINQAKKGIYEYYVYYPTLMSDQQAVRYVCRIEIEYINAPEIIEDGEIMFFSEEEVILEMYHKLDELPMEYDIDKCKKWRNGTDGANVSQTGLRVEFSEIGI